MNKRSGFLFVLLLAATGFIAWKANEPNPIYAGREIDSFVHPYPWSYVAWMVGFSLLVFGISFLKKPLARFIGAVFAFSFGAFLITLLTLTVMHAPPVHGALLIVVFFLTLALLFYTGYSCANWQTKRIRRDSAS